jgi:hypothetical protein
VIVCLSELFGFVSSKIYLDVNEGSPKAGARLKTPQRNCRDLQATIQELSLTGHPGLHQKGQLTRRFNIFHETLTSATSLLHPPSLFFSVLHCTSTLGSTHSDWDFEGSGSVKECGFPRRCRPWGWQHVLWRTPT